MKVYLCLFPALLLFALTGWGQGFAKNYPPPNSQFNDVVATPDGGYFLAGSTFPDATVFVQRVGPTGAVIWARQLPLNGASAIAACLASDGGFVVLAENYTTPQALKNMVLKINSSGDVEWQTQINNTLLANGLRDIIQTADGQFMAAGDTRDAQLRQNIWLVKLGTSGALLWSKSVGDTLYNEQVSRLLELPNGQIMVSGDGVHDTDRDLFLAKTDPNGNLLWEKWYTRPKVQNAHDLVRLSDGGLAVLADTYGELPTKIVILRTDAEGVLDFFWESSAGLSLATGSPYKLISSFATDPADNFFIPIASLEENILLKINAFGDSIWTKPLGHGFPQQIIRTTGGYFAIVGGDDDLGAFLVVTDAVGDIYTNKIGGNLYHDQNDNCVQDSGEPPLSRFIVRAENETGEVFFAHANTNGLFLLPVSAGNFVLSVRPRYGTEGFWIPCDSQIVTVNGTHQTVIAPPLGLRSAADCPLLDVEIGTTFLRRCTTSVFQVNYCNNGNLTSTNTSVQITPDPKITYQSSTVSLTSQNGNLLNFDVPDVLPGDCGNFNITFMVSCDAVLGEVLCTEAHIFPDSTCLPPNASWDGSHLVVRGTCNGDLAFKIRNTGAGSMTATADYVIIEDQIMYAQGKVQLNAGEDTIIVVPNPSGDAYQLRVNQAIGHPGQSQPSATVPRCAGASTSDLLLQLPQDEVDPFIATHCDAVIGSYDPNDKRGFPLGWRAGHLIERGQELEYMLRFQNTGTDTAFQVILRDTVTPLLDVTSLRAGASSHPYTYSVSGTGVVTFYFPDILLPDSNVNEAASHGYVLFRLRQTPGLAPGDVIENQAAIYFDFNEPVLTNTSFHTIGHPLISATVDRPVGNDLELRVFPNPLADQVTFQVHELLAGSQFYLSLFNIQGTLLRQEQFVGTDFQFQRKDLLPGVYFFQLTEKNGRMARGKIVVR